MNQAEWLRVDEYVERSKHGLSWFLVNFRLISGKAPAIIPVALWRPANTGKVPKFAGPIFLRLAHPLSQVRLAYLHR